MPRAPILLAAPVCLAACQLIGGIGEIEQADDASVSDGGVSDQSEAARADAEDASRDVRDDAHGNADGGGGDATTPDGQGAVLCPSLQMPTMKCSPGDFCCVPAAGPNPPHYGVCDSMGASCEGGVAVRCADKADCPDGELCCGLEELQTNPPQYVDVSCQKACTTMINAMRSIQLCAPDSGECLAPNPVCVPSMLLGGFSVCNP